MEEKFVHPFKGSYDQECKLHEIISTYKEIPGGLMPILQQAQGVYGYLPVEVQTIIADGLEISLSEVYGVATFYSQFTLVPKGQYRISVCLGTACYVKGSNKILEEVERHLSIKTGECTPDGLFSIDSTRCVGACGLAPVVMVNEDVYGKVTIDDVTRIIDSYTAKQAGVK